MKKINRIWTFMTAGLLVLGSYAIAQSAQTVSGTITEINKNENTLTIEPVQKQANLPDQLQLYIRPGADFKGIDSLRNLSVGDEISVEVEQSNAWFAQSIQAQKVSGRQAQAAGEAPNFFERAFLEVQQAWYRLRYDIRTDPGLYEEHAQARIDRADKRLQELKQEADQTEPHQQSILEVERNLQQAKDRLQRLKETEPYTVVRQAGERADTTAGVQSARLENLEGDEARPGQEVRGGESPRDVNADVRGAQQQGEQRQLSSEWKNVKSDLDDTLGNLRHSVHNAAETILPEKQVYEWETRNEIEEMKYDIKELRKAKDQMPADKAPKSRQAVDESIQKLENQVNQAEQKLGEIQKAGKNEWQDHRGEMDSIVHGYRSQYIDAFGKVGS